MISQQRFIDSALRLNVPLAAIQAVAEVESGGNGFLSTGEPTILFEPHIFWKRLKVKGFDPAKILLNNPEYSDILYPTWKPGKYGPVSKQHARMAKASIIHREAALESASWGKFQILGMNWKYCGVTKLQDFINAMYHSEDEHLNMFDDYIIKTGLDDELRALDWKGFARGYNGALYWKNQYDVKLKRAYEKYAG